MTTDDIINAARSAPRYPILNAPTPLERLDRLSDFLGIDLWIKRDDIAGPSFGGNKSRQLEYYFGQALKEDADTILITGAVQSNFVRLAAAIAAKAGLKAIVQLEERVDDAPRAYHSSGNVLLNQMLGAEIIHYPVGEDEHGADDALYREAERLIKLGRKPYVIPLGPDKPPLGALGYINCAEEIYASAEQAFDAVVVGTGSGATHLGILAGMKAFSPKTRVIGSCVRRDKTLQTARITAMMEKFNHLIGAEALTPQDIHIWDGALAPGYGKLSPMAERAMTMLAQHEGHILDPVYTAKVFAAVIGCCEDGSIKQGAKVVFIHSGGLGAFFAYEESIAQIYP